jgi:lysozyme
MTDTPVQIRGEPAQPKKGRLAALLGGLGFATLLGVTLDRWEGNELRGYRDIAGIATACRGVTGNGIQVGKLYTKAQCDALNEEAAARHVEGVLRCTPRITGYQLTAASALAYNIGVGAYCGSTAARRFNAGNLRGGCDAFLSWNKARVGKRLVVVQGLVNRRRHERELCLRGL